MDPANVSTVASWPMPTSQNLVPCFLRFASFYRKFFRKFQLDTQACSLWWWWLPRMLALGKCSLMTPLRMRNFTPVPSYLGNFPLQRGIWIGWRAQVSLACLDRPQEFELQLQPSHSTPDRPGALYFIQLYSSKNTKPDILSHLFDCDSFPSLQQIIGLFPALLKREPYRVNPRSSDRPHLRVLASSLSPADYVHHKTVSTSSLGLWKRR